MSHRTTLVNGRSLAVLAVLLLAFAAAVGTGFRPAQEATAATDYTVTKTADSPTVGPGGTIRWTIVATGFGRVSVSDSLPPGLTNVSISGLGWACVPSGLRYVCFASAVQIAGPLRISAKAGVTCGTTYTNKVQISPTDSNKVNNFAQSTVTVGCADLTLAKTLTTGSPQDLGAPIDYDILVTNVNPTYASQGTVTVSDTLPPGTELTGTPSGTGWVCSGTAGSTSFSCTTAAVAAAGGGTLPTIDMDLRAVSCFPNGGAFTNTATVSGGSDANATNNSSTSGSMTINCPDLDVDKDDDDDPVDLGQQFNFNLKARNIGGAGPTYGSYSITDTIPSSLTIGSLPAGCSAVGQVVTCTSSTVIAAGADGPDWDIPVMATTCANATSASNTATISGGGESNTGNNDSTEDVTFNCPDITIAKNTNDTQPDLGQDVTFSLDITVTNGPTYGTTTVTDTIDADLSIISATGQNGFICSINGQVVTCTNSSAIAVQNNLVVANILVEELSCAGTFGANNTASVSGGGENSAQAGNNTSNIVSFGTNCPDLQISKTAGVTEADLGEQFAYELDVLNVGTGPTLGTITVTDTIPDGLTIDAVNGAGWSCAFVGQVITCTTSAVIAAAGNGNNITITVTPNACIGDDVTNTASVSGGGENDTNDNTDNVDVDILCPDLRFSGSVDANDGDDVSPHYVYGMWGVDFTIENNGGAASTATTVEVHIPSSGTVFRLALPAGCSETTLPLDNVLGGISSRVVVCSVNALAPGASQTFTLPAFWWDPALTLEDDGIFPLEVVVIIDPNGTVTEGDEANNQGADEDDLYNTDLIIEDGGTSNPGGALPHSVVFTVAAVAVFTHDLTIVVTGTLSGSGAGTIVSVFGGGYTCTMPTATTYECSKSVVAGSPGYYNGIFDNIIVTVQTAGSGTSVDLDSAIGCDGTCSEAGAVPPEDANTLNQSIALP
jgi:fimbrial isopeptide formation D2 family protein/uncharacterized repeat protein (TIGR01451 family)